MSLSRSWQSWKKTERIIANSEAQAALANADMLDANANQELLLMRQWHR